MGQLFMSPSSSAMLASMYWRGMAIWTLRPSIFARLLLDSRVVDVPMAYNPTFVILSSLKPLFFNSLKNELRFSDHVGA